jgi:NAD-specific glutamate dehydrogenase
MQNALVEDILRQQGKRQNAVARWSASHEVEVHKVMLVLNDMHGQPAMDYATASVAVRALDVLVRATRPA